jgi:hypothetical protein
MNISLAFKHPLVRLQIVIYVILVAFWFWINIAGPKEGDANNLYGALYPVIALLGGLYGLFVVSKKWGGIKSVVGKGVFFLSLGLLAEVFGQWTWSYYTIIQQIEVPYPSIADIGYFAIIPFYGYAIYNFAIAAGVKVSLKSFRGKLQAILIPIFMIAVAYFLFLKDIEVDTSNLLRTFLDFGYPGFEAIAVSIGILTYSLSRKILGGVMKPRILYLVFALIAQYITDYVFLYRAGVGTYYNAGPVDLMYTTSFMIMFLGIAFFNLNHEKTPKEDQPPTL